MNFYPYKVKVAPLTCHCRHRVVAGAVLQTIRRLGARRRMGGQHHPLAALPRGKNSAFHISWPIFVWRLSKNNFVKQPLDFWKSGKAKAIFFSLPEIKFNVRSLYIFHPIWTKFGAGDLYKNLLTASFMKIVALPTLMFFWPCIMNWLYINHQIDTLIIIYS